MPDDRNDKFFMRRSDASIRENCLELIKRHTVYPIDYRLTRLYETGTCDELPQEVRSVLSFAPEELPVVLVIIDAETWTLITSRRITTFNEGAIITTTADQIQEWHWGDYKGRRQRYYTLGYLQTHAGAKNDIFIETQFASMLPIYAIMSLAEQLYAERDEDEQKRRDAAEAKKWLY